jgi:AcrR family transcriptional regulator
MVRAGLNAERVVLAGAELADELGFAAVTISLLARRLGVRTPSLYSHVDGSEDLRLRIAATALGESADHVETAVANRSGSAGLRAYADAWRDFARRHPGRYDATRQPVPPGADGDAALAVLAAGRRHADLARAVLRDYRITGADETHAVRLLGSLVHGYVSLELAGGFAHSRPSSDQSWIYAVDALDAMLRSGA